MCISILHRVWILIHTSNFYFQPFSLDFGLFFVVWGAEPSMVLSIPGNYWATNAQPCMQNSSGGSFVQKATLHNKVEKMKMCFGDILPTNMQSIDLYQNWLFVVGLIVTTRLRDTFICFNFFTVWAKAVYNPNSVSLNYLDF